MICSGGGGIPAGRNEEGKLYGIEAVVDKDLTGATLARELGADFFMILTDVPAVMENFGQPDQHEINRAKPEELRAKGFAAGSMGPKVEAACQFVEASNGAAGIGRLADAVAVIKGEAGTIITTTGEY